MSAPERHPATRPRRGIIPASRAGRLGFIIVTVLVGGFFALQVAAAVISVDRPWLALIIVPVGLAAVAAAAAIARLSESVLPQTPAGWLSLVLFALFLLFAAGSIAATAATGGDPWLALFIVPLAATSLGGGGAALLALLRRGERGALVMLPLIVGALALIFALGEVAAPH